MFAVEIERACRRLFACQVGYEDRQEWAETIERMEYAAGGDPKALQALEDLINRTAIW